MLLPLTTRLFALCGLELPGRQWALLSLYTFYVCGMFRWGL